MSRKARTDEGGGPTWTSRKGAGMSYENYNRVTEIRMKTHGIGDDELAEVEITVIGRHPTQLINKAYTVAAEVLGGYIFGTPWEFAGQIMVTPVYDASWICVAKARRVQARGHKGSLSPREATREPESY